MTNLDRAGRFIAQKLYRLYIVSPGEPGLTSFARANAHDRFCKMWPWSHHPWSARDALAHLPYFVRELTGKRTKGFLDG